MLKQVSTTVMIIEGLLLIVPMLFLDMVGSIGYLMIWMFLTSVVNLIFLLIFLNSDLERKGNHVVMLIAMPVIPVLILFIYYGILNK